MLRYFYADELSSFPKLRDTMFRDRADQFKGRLGWDVHVNRAGEERDEYDLMNPLYVIWQQADGRHGGSMRFLPTSGRTMVNDHFRDLSDGAKIQSPLIWECTRFCLGAGAAPSVSGALMLGGLELGLGHHLTHAVGVFDHRMVRVYRRLGWGPTVMGSTGQGRDAISVGLWAFTPEIRATLLQRTGIGREVSKLWYDRAFGHRNPVSKSA
ncbi:acyl-homoserine-lactone synthase [Halocynthiibacter namhaensis]|uniref:acyl-homoserine-lactone synthase n=1 Tax=Halocynthiibacter namhaensis TaxID=1290553 RepID=UPI000579978B|nr:acyl-homoserine-lactone synthase [Halocynthiibacter namhaensis]